MLIETLLTKKHLILNTGDIGGYMGLLLGASIISLVEIIDYILLGIVQHQTNKKNTQLQHVDTKQ